MSISKSNIQGEKKSGQAAGSDCAENMGNKKAIEDIIVPPDNVGNFVDSGSGEFCVPDGIGNSVNEEPCHLKSGILINLKRSDGKPSLKKAKDGYRQRSTVSGLKYVPRKTRTRWMDFKSEHGDGFSGIHLGSDSLSSSNDGELFFARMAQELLSLIKKGLGSPFVLSMKAKDGFIGCDDCLEDESLVSISSLLSRLLSHAAIIASIDIMRYIGKEHYFVVFFVNPTGLSCEKNKGMITALRRIFQLHVSRNYKGQATMLLALAKDRAVIEGHFLKLGISKI